MPGDARYRPELQRSHGSAQQDSRRSPSGAWSPWPRYRCSFSTPSAARCGQRYTRLAGAFAAARAAIRQRMVQIMVHIGHTFAIWVEFILRYRYRGPCGPLAGPTSIPLPVRGARLHLGGDPHASCSGQSKFPVPCRRDAEAGSRSLRTDGDGGVEGGWIVRAQAKNYLSPAESKN